MCSGASLAHAEDATTSLDKVVVSGQAPDTPPAQRSAPSQNSLEARSAQSTVSDEYIRNYTAPSATYAQALTMTPGAFSYTPNGDGLGDAKVTIRGLTDSNMVFSFDGIPFNDTNGVSHHSWVFFPAPFLGGAVVDRSAGTAATIGQATFGGTVDLKSRVLDPERRASVTVSDGTWNTRLLGAEYSTGQFGSDGKSNLLINAHELKSDGYQTYNKQDRKATSFKYLTSLGVDTELTLFGSYLNLKNNTPSIKGVSRSNYNAGNYNYLLSGDPTKANYYGYNFYNISTDFFYAGITSNLGDGWKLEDKVYTYKYHNKQNYNGSTISTTSAVDKLNAYTTMGNLLRASRESSLGTLRTGLWIDRADSHRFQVPSDPRTWVDQSAPNFSETYTTTTLQPYVEYEFKVTDALKLTPGVKYASYKQDFVHLQDNGGAVGTLGGTYNKTTGVITGGQPSIANSATYHDVLPALDLHYQFRPNWSGYAQFAAGDQIPDTSVFDVPYAKVAQTPKATKSKSVQFGTVWNTDLMTFAADVYHIKLDSTYTKTGPDAFGNYSYVSSGSQTDQGIEAESNIVLGDGFALYVNGTIGSLKYDSNDQWVAGAPRDTETVGLNFQKHGWALNLSANRIGRQYNDSKTGVHQAFEIDPIVVTNFFANYTLHDLGSFIKSGKVQVGVNNLFDKHNIVAIASAASGSSSANPSANDLLTVLAARSVSASLTLNF